MGTLFIIPGYILYVVAGLWGLFLCFGIIAENWGTFWALIGLFIAPIILGLAPLYEGFVNSNWMPFFVIYGGGIGGTVLASIGMMINDM